MCYLIVFSSFLYIYLFKINYNFTKVIKITLNFDYFTKIMIT